MAIFLAPARLVFSPENLWLLIACSVLLSALGNGLAWRLRRSSLVPRSAWALGVLSLFRDGGRFLYFVGLPYVALLGGLIPTVRVGLVSRDWARDLVLILPLSLGATLVLLVLRLLVVWREAAVFDTAVSEPALLPLGMSAARASEASHRNFQTRSIDKSQPVPRFGRLRHGLYREIHWAFYRSAPLLIAERREQGIALGLGIVALEAWLDPAWRSRWRDPDGALPVWQESALAVLMAVVFGISRNWWVTLAVHLIVETTAGWIWSRMGDFAAAVA